MGIGKRLNAAWQAIWGQEPAEKEIPLSPSDLAVELERGRLDLQDRESQLAKLRQEYARREEQAKAEAAEAGQKAMFSLGRKLGPLLSQLASIRSMSEAGREVRSKDVLILFGKIEKVLAEAGLWPIGQVGEGTVFDPRLHQRMSGGDVQEGDQVVVRFVGYKLGEEVVTKAMVSRLDQQTRGGD